MRIFKKICRRYFVWKVNKCISQFGARMDIFQDNLPDPDILEIKLGDRFTHITASSNNYSNNYFYKKVVAEVMIRC